MKRPTKTGRPRIEDRAQTIEAKKPLAQAQYVDGPNWRISSLPRPVDRTRSASRRRMTAICALPPFQAGTKRLILPARLSARPSEVGPLRPMTAGCLRISVWPRPCPVDRAQSVSPVPIG